MRRLFSRSITIALFCVCVAAQAQDRMPAMEESEMNEAQLASVAALVEARGYGPRGPWVPLLRSPEVMTRARAMGDYLRYNTSLEPRLSEFLILLTAREWSQQYEWYAHHDIALEAGINAETVEAIAAGRRPEGMADDHAILYALFTELNRTRQVSDDTYARAVEMFGERGVIDTVGVIGYYTLLAMAMNTARTAVPDEDFPPLPSLP
ncbi:MAG: carboxymuconolactone decarboxylase family protein [Candidatus Rariloculaceae bacterium]